MNEETTMNEDTTGAVEEITRIKDDEAPAPEAVDPWGDEEAEAAAVRAAEAAEADSQAAAAVGGRQPSRRRRKKPTVSAEEIAGAPAPTPEPAPEPKPKTSDIIKAILEKKDRSAAETSQETKAVAVAESASKAIAAGIAANSSAFASAAVAGKLNTTLRNITLPNIDSLDLEGAIALLKSADDLETTSWLAKAGTSHRIIKLVRAELQAKGLNVEKTIKTALGDLSKRTGISERMMQNQARTWAVFFTDEPYRAQVLKDGQLVPDTDGAGRSRKQDVNAEGNPFQPEWYFEVADHLGHTVYEAARAYAPNPSLALEKIFTEHLTQPVTVLRAKQIVDELWASSGLPITRPTRTQGAAAAPAAGTPAPATAPATPAAGAAGKYPGSVAGFLRAIDSANTALMAQTDPDKPVFVYKVGDEYTWSLDEPVCASREVIASFSFTRSGMDGFELSTFEGEAIFCLTDDEGKQFE